MAIRWKPGNREVAWNEAARRATGGDVTLNDRLTVPASRAATTQQIGTTTNRPREDKAQMT